MPATVFAALLAAAASADSSVITTVAGSGQGGPGPAAGAAAEVNINQPFGLEFGPDGALYVCGVGHGRIFRVDLKTGRAESVAGNGKRGNSGDGGPASEATLSEPYEIRFDAEGNLFFVDMVAAVVRRIDAKTKVITTVAGDGTKGFGGDGGPAVKAKLSQPHSIALDGKSGLYVADLGNHRIRKVDLASGVITTVAGTGEKKGPVEGPAAGKPMLGPRALFIDGGTMWIALREGHAVWRMDLASGNLTHVAGSGKAGYADGIGRAAAFNGPKGVAVRGGDVFVVDTENQVIRRVDAASGAVSTVAGAGPKARGFGGDGGPATSGKMDRPHGICVDAAGVLYIGDSNNHRVRRVGPAAGGGGN
jgi:sugar lactone lactonase YvrE